MIKRKVVQSKTYKDRKIEVLFVGPDLICHVDGTEVSSNFYTDVRSAVAAGERYIDGK